MDAADLKLWAQKWRWYERNSLPWNRARIHYEFARRRAFCRWPVHGNVLEMLTEGRLELLGPADQRITAKDRHSGSSFGQLRQLLREGFLASTGTMC